MSHCPECGATMDLDADELEEGLVISCPECAVDLEIVNTHPLEFDVIDEDEDEDEGADDEKDDKDILDEDDDDLGDEEDNGFH